MCNFIAGTVAADGSEQLGIRASIIKVTTVPICDSMLSSHDLMMGQFAGQEFIDFFY